MRVFLASLLSFAAFVVSAEPKPRHCWDFDALDWWSKQAKDIGEGKGRKPQLKGKLAAGQGSNGSNALEVKSGRYNLIYELPLLYDEFTVDLRFRLSAPLDGASPRTLWYYAWVSEESHRVLVQVTGEGGLEFKIGKCKVRSKPIGIKDGESYTLRFAVTKDGMFTAWLNGNTVLQSVGIPSLNALYVKSIPKSGYPLLCVGVNYDKKAGKTAVESLEGVLDDLAIHDVALGCPECVKTVSDYSNVVLPEFKPDSNGAGSVLILDDGGSASTERFCVLDHEEGVLGQMCKADRKFLDAASKARLKFDGNTVVAEIDCPVPASMSPECHRSMWRGDRVELFIRPSKTDTSFYLFNVTAQGASVAHGFRAPGVRDMDWKSGAEMSVTNVVGGFRVRIEVPARSLFKVPPKPGEPFGVNFVRHGITCGGKSIWAQAGGSFNLASIPMGVAVAGGSEAYFLEKMAAKEAQIKVRFKDADAQDVAHRALERVRAAVEQHSGDAGAFSSLERMFSALDRSFVQISLQGRSLVVYEPSDVWGASPDPDMDTKPLELMRLRAPLNGRVLMPIAVSNFKDEFFVGQIKFMDRKGVARSDWYEPFITNGVARHFTVRRSFPIHDRNGNRLYDPVMELPMQTVLRLAPGETTPLYCELDTHGMTPGRYYALLMLKRATPGFPTLRLPVEVEVLNANLDTVKADRFAYSFADTTFHKTRHACPEYVRRLVSRGYNMLLLSNVDWFPRHDESGRWQMPDFGSVDRFADAALAAGLAKDRMKFVVYLAADKVSMGRDSWVGLRDHKGKKLHFGTAKWDEGMRFMVQTFADHVNRRYGVGKDRIYWYPVDEPQGDIDDPKLESSISRAYHAAKVIKSLGTENLTMTDPLPDFLASKSIDKVWPSLVSVFDAIELYRPHLTASKLALVNGIRPKEVWTYSITNKETPPLVYAFDHWKNMRDNFREIATWWHMDQTSGGDCFDSTDGGKVTADYATLYVDFDHDANLLSRRQLAADQAVEDMRLVMFLKRKYSGDPSKLTEIQNVVDETVKKGTMKAIDSARSRLLDLLR